MVPVVSVEGLRVRFTTHDATVSAVNGVDFLQFRLAFQVQPVNAAFDFNGDGQINGTDFLQFRLRFLQVI